MGIKTDLKKWNAFSNRGLNMSSKNWFVYYEFKFGKPLQKLTGWFVEHTSSNLEDAVLEKLLGKVGHLKIYSVKSLPPKSLERMFTFLSDNPKITAEIYFAGIHGFNISRPNKWNTKSVKQMAGKMKELADYDRVKQMKAFGMKEFSFMSQILKQSCVHQEKRQQDIWDMETYANEEHGDVWKAIKNDTLKELADKVLKKVAPLMTVISKEDFKYKTTDILNTFLFGSKDYYNFSKYYVYYELRRQSGYFKSGWINDYNNTRAEISLLQQMNGENGHLIIYAVKSPTKKIITEIEHFLNKNFKMTIEIYFAHIVKLNVSDSSLQKDFFMQSIIRKFTNKHQVKTFKVFGNREWKFIAKKLRRNFKEVQKHFEKELKSPNEAIVDTLDELQKKIVRSVERPNNNYVIDFNKLWDCFTRVDVSQEYFYIYYEFIDENNVKEAQWLQNVKYEHTEEELLKKLKNKKKGLIRCFSLYSPCSDCADKIVHFLNKHPDITMELYFPNIINFDIKEINTWSRSCFAPINMLACCKNMLKMSIFGKTEWNFISNILDETYKKHSKAEEDIWDMKTFQDEEYNEVFNAIRENTVRDLITRIAVKTTILDKSEVELNKNIIWDSFQYKNMFTGSLLENKTYYIYYVFVDVKGPVQTGWAKDYKGFHAEVGVLSKFENEKGTLMIYSAATPCYIGCTEEIIEFLKVHQDIKLEIYFASIRNFDVSRPETWESATTVQVCKKLRALWLNANIRNMRSLDEQDFCKIFLCVGSPQQAASNSYETTQKNQNAGYPEIWKSIRNNDLKNLAISKLHVIEQ